MTTTTTANETLQDLRSDLLNRTRRGITSPPTTWSQPTAKMILDSISPDGTRICTLEVKMHRFVLAEFNTHRVFSRNAASSRAIPSQKQIRRVLDDPAEPVFWGRNQKGMQAAEPLTGLELSDARHEWYLARDNAVVQAISLLNCDLHKQLTNRLLEPWMWVTDIVTSTEWENFFHQRRHWAAQPEMKAAADAMGEQHASSQPAIVNYGEWHIPYIKDDEKYFSLHTLQRVGTARCARVSYLTHSGIRSVDEDLEMFQKLVSSDPRHASPLEHIATPSRIHRFIRPITKFLPIRYGHGNLIGWNQFRHLDLCA